MPLILAIETATKLCSVALARDGVVLSLHELESDLHIHAEKVNVFIAEVMAESGLSLTDLDAVAVGIGPGSYTGLRIGLSAAKGLCYALDKPIIGLNTLGTLVQAARATHGTIQGVLWPMIDARRMEVFTQPHDAEGKPLEDVAPLILDEGWVLSGGPRTVFGDGADKVAGLWAGHAPIVHLACIRPSAGAMLKAAEERLSIGDHDDLAYLVPAYGKAANVGKAKKVPGR